MDVMITISCYILPIDCLLIALDAHMLSHNGYGPGTRALGPKAAGPQAPAQQLLGPWSLVPAPGFYAPEPDPCRLDKMIGPDA